MENPTMDENIEFSNHNIPHTVLPHIQQLSFEPLSPRFRQTNFVMNLIFLSFVVTVLAFVYFQKIFELPKGVYDITMVVAPILLCITVIKLLYQLMADSRKFYSLREQDLSYSSGLIFKKTVTQPILRIQHIELKQGPIDRKVGLAKIQVFSAGGALHTFKIPGLTLNTAESIRQFVLDHKDVNNHG